MSRILCCCSLFCLLASTAFAQLPLSIGIKGGVSLTNAYQDNSYSIQNPFLSSGTFRYLSDAKDYIVGPFIQLRLPLGLAVEADGLYRPLSFASNTQLPNLVFPYSSRFVTWEFPILAQYRFRFPIVSPYIEGGPSFRTTTGNTRYLSNEGLAFGAGLTFMRFYSVFRRKSATPAGIAMQAPLPLLPCPPIPTRIRSSSWWVSRFEDLG